jgi:hypothetical protein
VGLVVRAVAGGGLRPDFDRSRPTVIYVALA